MKTIKIINNSLLRGIKVNIKKPITIDIYLTKPYKIETNPC